MLITVRSSADQRETLRVDVQSIFSKYHAQKEHDKITTRNAGKCQRCANEWCERVSCCKG